MQGSLAAAQARTAWGSRRVMGAMAAAQPGLATASMNLDGFTCFDVPMALADLRLPREVGSTIDLSSMAFKVHMAAGASWTQYCYYVPEAADVSHLPPDGEDAPLRRRCPLCLMGDGNFRHLVVHCQGPGLPELRSRLYDWAEARLREWNSLPWWLSPTAPRHPQAWVADDLPSQSHQICAATGWLLPTSGEHHFQEQNGVPGRPEGAFDLGYRALVPSAFLEALLPTPAPRPGSPQEMALHKDFAVKVRKLCGGMLMIIRQMRVVYKTSLVQWMRGRGPPPVLPEVRRL